MIDIHCHILPSIDDGSKHFAESIEMAKEAYSQGITTIIATPHHKNGTYENDAETVKSIVEQLNTRLEQEELPVTICSGQEVRIYGELIDDILEKRILSLNGSQYILVEFPSDHVPRYAEKLLFDIQLKGYIPVIAHPERNREIMTNPKLLLNLVKKGAASQVTAASITGKFGKNIKKFSLQLIESNLTHFMASDAHNRTNRNFQFENGLDVIKKEFGQDYVYLFTENAELLSEGKTIIRETPFEVRKRKILGLF
ncbi:CpsB/CapC family capsule biosynthesis tyrosine phosphatase [Bacillus gobiensis]|uniref:tyrosine-protein phosphatase n=1 Tax=Bacillus gobiensis TaxID=1441095 RepID=UPI003D1B5636